MNELALALVNLVALVGCMLLVRRAPCWMAMLTMILLCVTMVCLAIGYTAEAAHAEWARGWVSTGYFVEHLAILLTVFRLHFQKGAQWPSSSQPSRA